jgi:hypothetical protein
MACSKDPNLNLTLGNPGVNFSSSVYMRFDRPQQGGYEDCWFVAALSSYLFVNWKTPTIANGLYRFFFYDSRNRLGTIDTNGDVCLLNTSPKTIYGAKEIVNDKTYSWPAVYEKAYACYLDSDCPKKTTQPDMSKYIECSGNPLNCLQTLSGKRPYGFWTSSFSDADALFSFIWDRTTQVLGDSRKVAYPFVAWTSVAEELASHHSYSILGLYKSGNSEYIVLRDPKNMTVPFGASITWQFDDLELAPTGNSGEVETGNNLGIFVVSPDTFMDNIEGFGYVQ